MHTDKLSQQQKGLIQKHLELVGIANETVNLTRISSREEGMILHVEDSLAALEEMDAAPAGLYGDLGSGAGFPGIPLAVATGRKTILIDARKKKMDAVQGIIEELGLQDQVSTFAGRAELLARTRAGDFAVLTARALSQLSILLELASPLLKRHGHLICYKANVVEDEVSRALAIQKQTGMKLISRRKFLLEDTFTREILVFEKVKKPSVKLPRKEGEAQKNPLG